MIINYEGSLMIFFFNDLAFLIFPGYTRVKKGCKLAQLLAPILYTYKAKKKAKEKSKVKFALGYYELEKKI